MQPPLTADNLDATVDQIVRLTPVYDIFTHLHEPVFGDLCLTGIDSLLTQHGLVAEVYRYMNTPYDKFFGYSAVEQANLVWDLLFVQNSPVSVGAKGVLSALNQLGIDAKHRDLQSIRKWFAEQKREDLVNKCLELANVRGVIMVNSPFDDAEREVWQMTDLVRDERFNSALDVNALVLDWQQTARMLAEAEYQVTEDLTITTVDQTKKFLEGWVQRMGAQYLVVNLPPEFKFPDNHISARVLERLIFPFCEEFGIPLALMVGVKRGVNPGLRSAGDGMGRANLDSYERMAAQFPKCKLMLTVASRENQHELCVLARKFHNVHVFGCWWFNNLPQIIDETTRIRIELLGMSFTAAQSDARAFEQLLSQWSQYRTSIGRILKEKYRELLLTGWAVTADDVQRDVQNLFGVAFENFVRR